MARKLARTLVLTVALATLGVLANAPSALAYGNTEQWQIGFSGTCNNTAHCGPGPSVPGAFGFWGWCAFGGSDGTAIAGITTGTTADCQFTTYFRTAGVTNSPVHINFDISGWTLQAGSPLFTPNIPPGSPDFLFTKGFIEVTGPGASVVGIPTGVVLPLDCSIPGLCDTGLPAVPGHFSFLPAPGVEFNIQVTKLP